MDNKTLGILMWIFCLIAVFGFYRTFNNLNGVQMKSKYEGLGLSIFGVLGAIVVACQTQQENLVKLFEV